MASDFPSLPLSAPRYRFLRPSWDVSKTIRQFGKAAMASLNSRSDAPRRRSSARAARQGSTRRWQRRRDRGPAVTRSVRGGRTTASAPPGTPGGRSRQGESRPAEAPDGCPRTTATGRRLSSCSASAARSGGRPSPARRTWSRACRTAGALRPEPPGRCQSCTSTPGR